MEVIWHQAVSIGFRNRQNMFSVKAHEVGIIALLNKEILAVIAAVVNVVILSKQEGFMGHRFTGEWFLE